MLEFKNVLKVKNGDHYEEIPALKGSDASVTAENIASALGYTPANATELTGKQDVIDDLDTIRSKANSALQTETDPTVPSWAKAQNKPTYQANEIAMGDSTVGAEISDLIETVAQKQDALTDSDRQSITKTGLTSGAAWSATEQVAALKRIGAIADVSVNVPLAQFTVTDESVQIYNINLPNPIYHYFEIRAEMPVGGTSASQYIYTYMDGQQIAGADFMVDSAQSGAKYAYRKGFCINKQLFMYGASIPPDYLTTTSMIFLSKTMRWPSISTFRFRGLVSANKLQAGLTIRIYGA